jgi:hypothetical protein
MAGFFFSYRLINTDPTTRLGVGLLAMVDRAFSGDKRTGLERVLDDQFLDRDTGYEKETVRPEGLPVVDDEGHCALSLNSIPLWLLASCEDIS